MAIFAALSGFLGAGKTTTMLAAARRLEARGHRVAVVTNDQGSELVDTLLARMAPDGGRADPGTSAEPPTPTEPGTSPRAAEVTGGCFCCRFDDLADVVTTLLAGGAGMVIAEAVGSCTDLQATVVRPLRRFLGDTVAITPLTVVVDPHRYRLFARAWRAGADSDLAYLYDRQLAEADVIAVNKTDTVPPAQLDALLADVAGRYPAATVVPCSAAEGRLDSLLDCLFPEPGAPDGAAPSFPAPSSPRVPAVGGGTAIDYDRYAAAEAELAWLNQAVAITAADPAGFAPAQWAAAALSSLSDSCEAAGALVGHAKIIVLTGAGAAKASLTVGGGPVQLDLAGPARASTARAVVNLRVSCSPADLDRAAAQAVRAADSQAGAGSVPEPGPPAFRPRYPRPTHRIPYSG